MSTPRSLGAQDSPLPAALAAAALPDAERDFYSRDVYRQGALPRAVLRPRSRDELRAVVVEAARAGLAIVTRGGGASYTDAHLPSTTASIVLDTSALDRVLSIDEADMTVSVEPGITWAALDATLAQRGLKVPFVGTFSGLAATVGGTTSQNANGHGSNGAGISADSVVAVEVLTPRGEFVHTATAGAGSRPSLYRNYGPDLTGVFLGDSGALGIKTKVVLKLLRRKPVFEAASFAFPDFRSLHGCMARLASERLDDKSFGLDQALQQGQIARQDAASMLGIARSIWNSSPDAATALASLARMAAAGTRDLATAPYAAHYIVDGHERLEARSKIATLRRLATSFGREIANSVPTVVRANPFQPLHNMLGPAGERWVPLHGLLPHSRVLGLPRGTDRLRRRAAQRDGREPGAHRRDVLLHRRLDLPLRAGALLAGPAHRVPRADDGPGLSRPPADVRGESRRRAAGRNAAHRTRAPDARARRRPLPGRQALPVPRRSRRGCGGAAAGDQARARPRQPAEPRRPRAVSARAGGRDARYARPRYFSEYV